MHHRPPMGQERQSSWHCLSLLLIELCSLFVAFDPDAYQSHHTILIDFNTQTAALSLSADMDAYDNERDITSNVSRVGCTIYTNVFLAPFQFVQLKGLDSN